MLPLTVAVTVMSPLVLDVTEPVTTPFAPVGPAGCVTTALPLAASVTAAPEIGFPFASRTVTVIALEAPTATDVGSAVTVETVGLGAPGTTVTVAVCETSTPLIVAAIVFTPAPVDCSVAVVVPFALVTAGVETVLPLPLTESVTAAPPTGTPEASRATTVMVLD